MNGTRGCFIASAVAITALFASPARAVNDLSLNVAPGSQTVAPGDTITVTLDMANLSNAINGVQVLLNYDPTLMSLIDIVPTDLGLAAPAQGWLEISQSDAAGDITWAAVINGGSILINHTVATMTFTALAPGTPSVVFRADASPFFTKLTRASDNATILPIKIDSGLIVITCDDGLFCNGLEFFSAGACQPGSDPCNDAVGCTTDSCDEVADTCGHVPVDAACDNGLFCDGAETCNPLLDCQPGTFPCDDGVACTVDTCDDVADTCSAAPSDALCDNGLFCDGTETCDLLAGCLAGTFPCDDAVGCTDETCDEVLDTCTSTPNDANCDNGLFCDGAETCDALLDCQAGTNPCDDAVGCTVDTCAEAANTCTNTPADVLCTDGQFCNGNEFCDPVLDCQAGTDPCNDGVACTDDTCDDIIDTCSNVANDANCDDALFCNGVEVCNALLDCQAGTDPCDDAVGCTDDVCDEVLNSCASTPNDVNCDNGLFCDGSETCDAVFDCQLGTNPCDDAVGCTVDTCDEVADTCANTPADVLCDNTQFCDGAETCDPINDCQPGTDPCNDGVACTDDTCDDVADTCTNTTNNANCDDGQFCNGAETCDALLDCQAGADPCEDLVGCTVDSCAEAANQCINTPTDSLCDNGLFCDGAETCDALLDCQGGADPCEDFVGCTVDSCAEANNLCINTPTNSLCDNGLFCDGAETCDAVTDCQPGTFPCNDSVGCTDDSCDDVLDTCTNAVNDANCDNGLFCDGAETCDLALDCQPGTFPCDDFVACTDETCDEVLDLCSSTANDANCDDSQFCNGAETCDPVADCLAGSFPCDDAVGCTDDTCDDVSDTCSNTANDANCDDALFCNGAETCNLVSDCQPGTDPCNDAVVCTDDSCDDVADTCTNAANDANCDDGLFCTGTEVCDPALDCQVGVDPCAAGEFCNDVNNTCDTCVLNSDCDDSNVCTSDTCNAGACVNTNLFDDTVDCCDPILGTLTTLSDGNTCTTDICNADGTVSHVNAGEISINLKVEGISSAVTREVVFVITDCTGAVDVRPVSVPLDSFGIASVTLTTVDAAADSLSVQDGHTLRRLSTLSFNVACQAAVDLSGAQLLLTGDLQTSTVPQDNVVDITDFSILASRWNTSIDPTLSTGGDVTGDGLQFTTDFTAMQLNFFLIGEGLDTCGGGAALAEAGVVRLDAGARGTLNARPVAKASVAVDSLSFPGARRADFNGDGLVDSRDIRAFAKQNGLALLPEFERSLTRLETRKGRSSRRR